MEPIDAFEDVAYDAVGQYVYDYLTGFGFGTVVGGTNEITHIKKVDAEKTVHKIASDSVSGHSEVDGISSESNIDKSGGNAVETSYGKSTLNSLKNTENFTDSSIEHIFEGQVNARGKAVGYHYEGIENTAGKVVVGTESIPNNLGIYKAQVEVSGIPKTANVGFSSFYPKGMSPQQVIDAINEAYNNCDLVIGTRNTYRGITTTGMEIDMYLDQNKKIISAFPKE